MKRRNFLKTVPAPAALTTTSPSLMENRLAKAAPMQGLQPVILPKFQTDGGKSILAALKERRTNRNIHAAKLPPQMLSNLLWAAFGINREKGNFGKPGSTAPSASNSQEIDLYVTLPEGVYLYEAVSHSLRPIATRSIPLRNSNCAPTSMCSLPKTWVTRLSVPDSQW